MFLCCHIFPVSERLTQKVAEPSYHFFGWSGVSHHPWSGFLWQVIYCKKFIWVILNFSSAYSCGLLPFVIATCVASFSHCFGRKNKQAHMQLQLSKTNIVRMDGGVLVAGHTLFFDADIYSSSLIGWTIKTSPQKIWFRQSFPPDTQFYSTSTHSSSSAARNILLILRGSG